MTPVADSQRGKPRRRLWRAVRWIGAGLVVLIIALAMGGFLWNTLATRYYRDKYPAPGKMYAVNGYTMHMYCTGSGSPTLILDSGLGDDWTVWEKVRPTLSKTTQVCSYDRSGLGWTDEISTDHDANTLADQLHALLQQAGIQKPVILMGHSMAGVYDRAYAARYPNDVAALIFVDASTPDMLKGIPKEFLTPPNYMLMRWENILGVARAMGECSEITPGLEFERGQIYANNCKASVVDTTIAEMKDMDRSFDETRPTGSFGSLPILVFSEDSDNLAKQDPGPPFTPALMKKAADEWEIQQETLKHLSSNDRRIIAKGSGHFIEVDRADLVNQQVPVFIQQVRTGTTSPDNGTTKIE
jgi:pimeloyl-ACP methyl ester carboxylesterase